MYSCGAVWFRLDIARGNPAKVNHWCMQFILTANDTILTGGHNTSQYRTRGHNTPRYQTKWKRQSVRFLPCDTFASEWAEGNYQIWEYDGTGKEQKIITAAQNWDRRRWTGQKNAQSDDLIGSLNLNWLWQKHRQLHVVDKLYWNWKAFLPTINPVPSMTKNRHLIIHLIWLALWP